MREVGQEEHTPYKSA